MLKSVCDSAKEQMFKTVNSLKKNFSTIRTGRASVSLFDDIRIDCFGISNSISQIASIVIAEPRLILIKPWDKNMLKTIEKAIQEANLGLNPIIDGGDVIRVPLPFLTEERRRELVKQARQRSEEAKISCRNIRREANENLKKYQKDNSISGDDEKRGSKVIQDLTNKVIIEIERLFENKELEIMKI